MMPPDDHDGDWGGRAVSSIPKAPGRGRDARTPVGHQHGAGDERGVVRGEEQRTGRELRGARDPLQRDPAVSAPNSASIVEPLARARSCISLSLIGVRTQPGHRQLRGYVLAILVCDGPRQRNETRLAAEYEAMPGEALKARPRRGSRSRPPAAAA